MGKLSTVKVQSAKVASQNDWQVVGVCESEWGWTQLMRWRSCSGQDTGPVDSGQWVINANEDVHAWSNICRIRATHAHPHISVSKTDAEWNGEWSMLRSLTSRKVVSSRLEMSVLYSVLYVPGACSPTSYLTVWGGDWEFHSRERESFHFVLHRDA